MCLDNSLQKQFAVKLAVVLDSFQQEGKSIPSKFAVYFSMPASNSLSIRFGEIFAEISRVPTKAFQV